jgi:hypothetical protein
MESGSHIPADVSSVASVILGIQNERIKLQKSKIKDIAKGLAEIAYSMGETNDVEALASLMAEDILEGFKKAEKRRKARKRKTA